MDDLTRFQAILLGKLSTSAWDFVLHRDVKWNKIVSKWDEVVNLKKAQTPRLNQKYQRIFMERDEVSNVGKVGARKVSELF